MNQRSLVVVTAGLTRPSSTRLLADRLSAAAVDAAAALGVTLDVRVLELRDLAHDVTNHLLTGFPPAALRDALDAVGVHVQPAGVHVAHQGEGQPVEARGPVRAPPGRCGRAADPRPRRRPSPRRRRRPRWAR